MTASDNAAQAFGSRAIHAGQSPDPTTGVLAQARTKEH
jgi:hypothetical protein